MLNFITSVFLFLFCHCFSFAYFPGQVPAFDPNLRIVIEPFELPAGQPAAFFPPPVVRVPPLILGPTAIAQPVDALLAPNNQKVDPFLMAILRNDPGYFKDLLERGARPSDLAIQRVVDLKNLYFFSLLLENGVYPAYEVFFTDDQDFQALFRQFQISSPLDAFFHQEPHDSFENLIRISQNSAGMARFIFSHLLEMSFHNPYIESLLQVADYAASKGFLKSINFSWVDTGGKGVFNFKHGRNGIPEGFINIESFVILEAYGDNFVRGLLSTFLHELNHAMMFLLFNNRCSPYLANDRDSALEFEEAFAMCFSRASCWNEVETEVLRAIKHDYHPSLYHEEMSSRFIELFALGMTIERAEKIMPEMVAFWDANLLPALMRFYQDVPSSS